MTTALVLSDEHDVSVVAELVGKHSDSRKATAIWHVYLVPETEQVLLWAEDTLGKLCEIAANETDAGVEIVEGVELFRRGVELTPTWAHIPPLFRILSDSEVARYNDLKKYDLLEDEVACLKRHPVKWGYEIKAPAAAMDRYLSWLEARLHIAGVRIDNKRITDLEEIIYDTDCVVNCGGFGARELVGDAEFIPYKGQYFVIKANDGTPKTYVGDDDHPLGMAYMIPRLGEVMVGGTAEEGTEDLGLTLDWSSTLRRAGLYVPWLLSRSPDDQARPPVVGIRPCRLGGVRLEVDSGGWSIPVVHNYGHGGSGFSLSWGCAETVRRLVETL